ERVVRRERLLNIDVHAAERVDDLLEGAEVDDGDVVDVYAGEVFHGLHHQRNATPGVRCVDLRHGVAVVTVRRPRNMYPGVARNRHQLGTALALRHVSQNDRVAARARRAVRVAAVAAQDQQVLRVRGLGRLLRARLQGDTGERVDPGHAGLHRVQVPRDPARGSGGKHDQDEGAD